MNGLVQKDPEFGRKSISRGALGNEQLKYGLRLHENLHEAPTQLPPAAQARFCVKRIPSPPRPHFSPVADGFAAQFSTPAGRNVLEGRLDIGDLALFFAPVRL